MSDGYTLSYRRKWENPVFRNKIETAIWGWMCDMAAWREITIRFNGEMITLQRGQLATSRRYISEGFGIGEQVTRTFLENLEKAGMVNQRPTHKGTVLTICNYDEYQPIQPTTNPPDNPKPTRVQPTSNPNNNELNEDNEFNEKRRRQRSAKPSQPLDLPDWLPQAEWEAYRAMRKRKRAPLDDYASQLAIRELTKLREQGHDPKAVLEQSVFRSWTGVFPIKSETTKGAAHGKHSGFAEQDYRAGTDGFIVT